MIEGDGPEGPVGIGADPRRECRGLRPIDEGVDVPVHEVLCDPVWTRRFPPPAERISHGMGVGRRVKGLALSIGMRIGVPAAA